MNNSEGMTLIEVIIAIAIIGIITISFLSVFSTGFSLVNRAGDKSEEVFINHAEIEASLSSFGIDNSSELELKLSDGTVIEVPGEIGVFTQESGKGTTSITIFRPGN